MSKNGKKSSIDEAPLRSGPNDFNRFLGSTIWFDIENLIKDRIEVLVNQLTQCSDTNELIGLKHEIKAWKEMLGVPSYLKSCAHQDKPAKQSELDLE